MCFHRLGINGIGPEGSQPFTFGDFIYMCNGEIYNYKQLAKAHSITLTPNGSDCEIIGHLLQKFPVAEIPNMLEGYFAVVIYNKVSNYFQAFTDNLGVKPLYYGYDYNGYTIASELKCIKEKNAFKLTPEMMLSKSADHFKLIGKLQGKYYDKSNTLVINSAINKMNFEQIMSTGIIYNSLMTAVKKRVECMDKSIQFGCFLSGGLDSSIVCAILASLVTPNRLNTFSIGLAHSEDLQAARVLAAHINSIHHEYIVTEEQLLEEIENVIECVETYDTTTIRASTPMYLLCKRISCEYPAIKVIFSGELADELSGSYKYFKFCPNDISHKSEVTKLIRNVNTFDLLRADKTTAHHGLEIRVPFADVEFMYNYLSIEAGVMRSGDMEKWILRHSFKHLLPSEIAWRSKMAFSDGISSAENPWFKMIKQHVDKLQIPPQNYNYLKPRDDETAYYRYVFEKLFPGRESVIRSYWMPNASWCPEATDPSALTL
jgi:asparagine synthase (glutamine-hydrolysing)